jgi:hypothetical protein
MGSISGLDHVGWIRHRDTERLELNTAGRSEQPI